jgi:hypothetical protein
MVMGQGRLLTAPWKAILLLTLKSNTTERQEWNTSVKSRVFFSWVAQTPSLCASTTFCIFQDLMMKNRSWTAVGVNKLATTS